ncbi:MAG: hypothetical protein B1H03_02540 [Planctomycetales bacterium 4484_113]|nr:MAG: hypothetical protein B1H03_02540 [Planctomycetales bacterium 4484_113]
MKWKPIELTTLLLALLALAAALPHSGLAFAPGSMLPGTKQHLRRSPARVVALTFDDGPDADFTLPIAELLHSRGVKAAFFFLGRRIAEHQDVARRVAALGFELGNHSYDHPDMTEISTAEVEHQLDETNRLLSQVAAVSPRFFRPPYGSFNARVLTLAEARGMSTVLWSVDSRDWAEPDPAKISSRVLAAVRPGAIILLHSTHPQTLAALPAILDGLEAQGYRVESVSGWLAALGGQAAMPAAPPRFIEGPVLLPQAPAGTETPPVPTTQRRAEQPVPQPSANESEYRIFSNIRDIGELYGTFLTALLVPRAGASRTQHIPCITWQRSLPARSPELYDREFLFNNRVYAPTYYPQPRFFLLLKWEQMAEVDAQLLQRLVQEGGMSYTLMLAREPGRRMVGEFGLPARLISPNDYDTEAVFVLGRDSLSELVGLFRRKKAAIFVSLALPDEQIISAQFPPAHQ